MVSELNRQQRMDQASADIGETYPPMLWRFNKGCLDQGFTGDQAFFLTSLLLQLVFAIGKDDSK